MQVVQVGSAQMVFSPWATRSGLPRPSAVGPREEKDEMTFADVTLPTATMLSQSDGVQSVVGEGPVLPMAVTTRTPWRLRIFVASAIGVVLPFREAAG